MYQGKIFLKKGKESSTLRKHHWIFSGAIQSQEGNCDPGSWVQVYSQGRQLLGSGYVNGGSIAVKLLSFSEESMENIFREKLAACIALRNSCGLLQNAHINCFRLVHAEGDGFPGLIADVYGNCIVLQVHHAAYLPWIEQIGTMIAELFPVPIDTILVRLSLKPAVDGEDHYFLKGSREEDVVKENGLQFYVNWKKGQKTGFFLDQRDNRELVKHYSRDKKVLNTFSYTGGFSVYALAGGATQADSVDVSGWAIETAEKNVELNGFGSSLHQGIVKDVVPHIRELGKDYDMIILDPPAFAKSLSARHNALMAYKRINAEAMKNMKKGGMLFTFSCSQVVDKLMFRQTVQAAAIEARKDVRVIHQLSQPADHPVNIFHPESEYLKGLVLLVQS